MTLNPISIATYGAECHGGPEPIALATLGLVCVHTRRVGGGGSAAVGVRTREAPKVYRVPMPRGAVQDDEEVVIITLLIAAILNNT